jgi:hypothetical protein
MPTDSAKRPVGRPGHNDHDMLLGHFKLEMDEGLNVSEVSRTSSFAIAKLKIVGGRAVYVVGPAPESETLRRRYNAARKEITRFKPDTGETLGPLIFMGRDLPMPVSFTPLDEPPRGRPKKKRPGVK